MSADDMAAMRQGGEEGEARYKDTLKAARWQTWVMSMQVGRSLYVVSVRMSLPPGWLTACGALTPTAPAF